MVQPALARHLSESLEQHRVATPLSAAADVIETAAGLDDVAATWDAVAPRFATPVQHFIWTRAAAGFPDFRPCVIVARAANGTAAIAPLALRGSGVRAQLELIGARELHEPMDIVCRDGAALAELALAIRHTGLPVWLERVP